VFSEKTYWQKIADNISELEESIPPNKYKSISVRGKEIILGKGSKGLFAMKNKCPHQNKRLSEGFHENDKAVCIYHRFSFDVYTGVGGCGGVDTYKIEQRENGVYLGVQYFSIFG